MANGRDHEKAGTVAGGVLALLRSDPADEPWKRLLEGFGGAVAGRFVGGPLPDLLEPAIHGWHRDVAHSVAVGAGIVHVGSAALSNWEQHCRASAEHYASQARDLSATPAARMLAGLAEVFWRTAAGFLAGVVGGYLSHLALDARTSRGIPIITRRF